MADRESLQRTFNEANIRYENSVLLADRAARIRDHDLRRFGHTANRGIIMAEQKSQLVDPLRRKTVAVAYVDFMLLEFCVGGGRHNRSGCATTCTDTHVALVCAALHQKFMLT